MTGPRRTISPGTPTRTRPPSSHGCWSAAASCAPDRRSPRRRAPTPRGAAPSSTTTPAATAAAVRRAPAGGAAGGGAAGGDGHPPPPPTAGGGPRGGAPRGGARGRRDRDWRRDRADGGEGASPIEGFHGGETPLHAAARRGTRAWRSCCCTMARRSPRRTRATSRARRCTPPPTTAAPRWSSSSSSGAPVNAGEVANWRPIHEVAHTGHQKIGELLLAAGADPNARAGGGWHALHQATGNGTRRSSPCSSRRARRSMPCRRRSGDRRCTLPHRWGGPGAPTPRAPCWTPASTHAPPTLKGSRRSITLPSAAASRRTPPRPRRRRRRALPAGVGPSPAASPASPASAANRTSLPPSIRRPAAGGGASRRPRPVGRGGVGAPRRLHSLDLDRAALGVGGAAPLAAALERRSGGRAPLTTLKLSFNSLGDAGVAALAPVSQGGRRHPHPPRARCEWHHGHRRGDARRRAQRLGRRLSRAQRQRDRRSRRLPPRRLLARAGAHARGAPCQLDWRRGAAHLAAALHAPSSALRYVGLNKTASATAARRPRRRARRSARRSRRSSSTTTTSATPAPPSSPPRYREPALETLRLVGNPRIGAAGTAALAAAQRTKPSVAVDLGNGGFEGGGGGGGPPGGGGAGGTGPPGGGPPGRPTVGW